MTAGRPLGDYAFHARIRKQAVGPTFLHFASPTPPQHAVITVPTILRDFSKKNDNAAVKPDPDAGLAPQLLPQPRGATRAQSMPPFQSVSTARRYHPVAPLSSAAAPSLTQPSASSPEFAVHSGSESASTLRPGNGNQLGRDSCPPAFRRAHSVGGTRHSAAGKLAALDPSTRGPGVPPRLPTPGITTRSVSTKSLKDHPNPDASSSSNDLTVLGINAPEPADPNEYVRHKKMCQLTDEEKQRNRKGKHTQDPLQTAWFEYEGDYPLRLPPNLSGHAQIQHGDIFWYRSSFGIQLWLWTEGADEDEDFWRPVLLGVAREADSRFLGLNPSQRPSWMTSSWLGKQKKTSVRVFIHKC